MRDGRRHLFCQHLFGEKSWRKHDDSINSCYQENSAGKAVFHKVASIEQKLPRQAVSAKGTITGFLVQHSIAFLF
jgi:hypothetical protein